MNFSEMQYVRPDIEKLSSQCIAAAEAFSAAKSFEEAEKALLERDRIIKSWATQTSLAYIRHTVDTNDSFYTAEDDYINEVSPQAEEMFQKISESMLKCKFRPELEEKYGALMFRNIEISLKTFSPAIIPDMQEENRLTSEYQNLIASAQIDFDGKKLTLSQMSPYKTGADDKLRAKAWKAEGEWYEKNGGKLDEIYGKLVKTRTEQAKKLGYKSFTELGYYRMNRNCYDRKDVEKFRESVVKHIVPLCDRLARDKAQRLGFSYPMTYSDNALDFRSGNPRPQVSPEEILAHGKRFYHDLSDETAEFIDFMYDNGLLDVMSKTGKAAGGYCTELPDYKAPYIFANFNGTAHDVEVITHEAGHAFAFYKAREIVPFDNASPTIESCEIHSTTMEFFAWDWVEGFFGKDSDKYRYYHLSSSLMIIPYICLVDHFQHEMYEKPELSPAERHTVWAGLTKLYMPWICLDGSVFYGEGKAWQRQLHIYENPFYYIDYALATTAALEFWAIMRKNLVDAWKRYIRLVNKAGSESFNELLQTAGLESPFDDKALTDVAEAVRNWLDGVDAAKLG